jgi:hypothetical protein
MGIANNNNKTTIMPINNTPNADGANTINIMMRVVIRGLRLTKSIIESINADKKFIIYILNMNKIFAKLQKNHYSEKYMLVVWIKCINFDAK